MKGIFMNPGIPPTIMPLQVIYITAALLFLAILPMPADFYTLLRIVAAGTFAWGAYRNFGKKLFLLPLAYTMLAILFNPVMEINLAKEISIPLNLLAAVLLLSTKNHIVQ
jgi:hypothetical protein